MQRVDFDWSVEEKSILSELQMTIFEKKAKGESVADIMHDYGLNISNIYKSLQCTIRGDRWEPGLLKGGAPSYLGEVEKSIIKQDIINRGIDMNCAKTIEVVQSAIELREKRYI